MITETKQLDTIGCYTMWHSKGDAQPYWFSDSEGTELFTFTNKQTMIKELKEIWRRQLALEREIGTIDKICVSDNYDEFYTDHGAYEVVPMDVAISNELDWDFYDDNDMARDITKQDVLDMVTDKSIGAYDLIVGTKYFVREL